MFSEQRRHRRVSLRTRIDVDSASNFYTGFVENISSGGLFISSRELREIGEIVRIRFTLPDAGPPIEADAIVRWVRELNPTSDVVSGFGVEFGLMTERDRARINAFIEQRAPIFYVD